MPRTTLPVALALILALAPLVGAAHAGDPSPIERALQKRAKLLDFNDLAIQDAFGHIAHGSGVNLVIDANAAARLEEHGNIKRLVLRDITYADALHLLFDLYDLGAYETRGVLLVTDALEASLRPLQTRVYDVRELLVRLEDFPGRVDDLARLRASALQPKDPLQSERDVIYVDALVDLIQTQIAPETWEASDTNITASGGRLIIRHGARVHEQIVHFLRDLQQFATVTIRLDAWLVPSDGGALGTRGRPMPIADWRKQLRTMSDVEHLSLTAYNSQRVHLHSGARVPFSRGELGGHIRTGTLLDVRPTYSPRVGAVWLELRAHRSALRDASLAIHRLRTNVLLPADHAVAVAGGRHELPGRTLVLAASVRSSGPAARERRRQDDPALARIRKQLTARVDLDLDGLPLTDVLDSLAKTAGVNIVLDPAILEERTEDELRVNLRVQKLDVESALKLILELKQLGYDIAHGAVVIRPRSEVASRAITRVYDVRDLSSRLPDLPETFAGASRGLEDDPLSPDRLATLIRENVAPDAWEDDHHIRSMYGSIIVRNHASVLAGVEGLLAKLRKISSSTVCVELTALRDPDSHLERAGFRGQIADSQALSATLAQLVEAKHVTVAGEAVLQGFNTQLFGLFVGKQTIEPPRAIREDGLKVDVRPVLSLDGKNVTLTIRSDVGQGHNTQRFATTVHFPTTHTVILGGSRHDGVVLLLRVTPLD